ncbi:hypothetical protein GJ496_004397 [Pomphorhynchus laevis]|nr:hypothetical protein GJ496_004397 [Pomphorhynchus laevis]
MAPTPWFANLSLRINEDNLAFEHTAVNNMDMVYFYYTAMCDSAVRMVNEHLIAYISRACSEAVGNYIIEFRDSFNPGSNLQTTLRITRRMSQSLVPMITLGSSSSNNTFLSDDRSSSVAVAIANDQLQWVDITVEDNLHEGLSRRIIEAVAAQRLVLLADHFTIDKLAILRLIANGLPQLATNADSATVILLDELKTPAIPILILGREAVPAYPADVPTALEISTTLAKLSKALYEGAACYSGLVRDAATAFRFRGRGDNRAYVDGVIQHRRSIGLCLVSETPWYFDFG